ncbi:NUDIX domain-containing protein [Parvibaculum sedimenti]|uniref:NUDIX domain-containing protein n=1 Tax=Parvibaculum sedimenti TaxID=2608632 RepID=A0A6N6VIG4_9HYPH|nr:NUDIX hydrolase [Parvibaculum sedimenti]KAB7740200.1 NUDIX domain-containing protein [Parvibaculum sedimenti]
MTSEVPLRPRSIRPRDAASLVLVDDQGDEPRILMGRRHARMAFVPDAFVFPGGKLDPDDFIARPATELPAAVNFGPKARALAMAAIRETFEETGLLLAAPGEVGAEAAQSWAHFRECGIAPRLDALSALARAITPVGSPIRFHARFFTASASALEGTLAGSGELEDLDWYPLSEALKLPIIDVTEFVLHEVAQRRNGGTDRVPLYSYRNGQPLRRP